MKLTFMIFFMAIGIVYYIDAIVLIVKHKRNWWKSMLVAGCSAWLTIMISVARFS